MPMKLTEAECVAAQQKLPDWSLDDSSSALSRSFRFTDFAEAFAFMTRVALMAERMHHHPDWRNSYNRVDITLTTHDAEGLTSKDVLLGRAIDSVYADLAKE